MAYLVLSNLILILVPLALKFVRSFSRYPDRLDFLFSVLTLAIILVGFLPEHVSSMSAGDLTLVVLVVASLELLERLGSIEEFGASKKIGYLYFLLIFLLVSFHAFLDGMGFHLEQSLTGVNAHQHEEHAHNHDHYSLSLGLLLHRFPIGVLLYQKFFTIRSTYREGILLVSSMITATIIGYLKYDSFSEYFGSYKFAHTFEYFVVAILLHFVATHIYSKLRKKI